MSYKTTSLKRNLAWLIIALAILFSGTIISFQMFLNNHEYYEKKVKQYNQTNTLLNELFLTVSELNNLYQDTNNPDAYNNYQDIVLIYKGEEERQGYPYIVEANKKISYRMLITQNIKIYDEIFLDEIDVLLDEVDVMIERHLSEMEPNNYLNFILPSDTPNVNAFILKLAEHHQELTTQIEQENLLYKSSAYTFLFLIIIYGLYVLFKIYRLMIKPIIKAHQVVNQINDGNETIRLTYPYRNELSGLITSINKYIDISQSSLKLIEDQYTRLKLYADIGQINYLEYDFKKREVKIYYSQKFINKYNIQKNIFIYSVDEYMKMIHPEDLDKVKKYVNQIDGKQDKEYKTTYRIKYPNASEYCTLSTMGQLHSNKKYFIAVEVDITYLAEIQQKLEEQEDNYRLIVENTTDLIGKFKVDGTILYLSKAYQELFKGDKENINDYNEMLKVTNNEWLENLTKPPYSTQNLILIDTKKGERWISWNNDAIRNEDGEIEYIVSVGHDITELKNMNEKLKYDSEHDSLTGLLNRRGLFNQLKKLNVTSLAAFFIDINQLKTINDFYGHELGDEVIKLFAKDLDAYNKYGCMTGRLSGDEFLILVPDFHGSDFLQALINHLNQSIFKNYRIDTNDIYISSSIGYALYPQDTNDFEQLITYADIAMYESKVTHQRICLRFAQNMYDLFNNKVQIANDLKSAIDQDEFEMYYQSIINSKTGKVEYIETLARWNSHKGLISPDIFLPIAEESGFMQTLDLLFIKKSLSIFQQMKQNKNFKNTKLSLNVSPFLLLQHHFPKQMSKLVKKNQLNFEEICIEISENTFFHNIEQSRRQIADLRHLGFKIALDDFGREYSSLSILDKVSFDIIKIDRAFSMNLKVQINIEIIRMITKVAKLTSTDVIVEGIENKEQIDVLNQLGCYLMQGFYYSKPTKYKTNKES